MDFPSCPVLELFRKFIKIKYLSKPIGCIVLLSFLIIFSAACGKQRARVKPPLPPSPPAAPAAKTAPAVRKEPPVASQPAPPPTVAEEAVQKTVPGPVMPATESIASTADFVPGPLIRIALTTEARNIQISSLGDFYVMEKTAEASRQLTRGDIRVRVEQEAVGNSTVFRVQVASYTKMDLAQDLKRRLSEAFNQPVIIHDNAAAGLSQVWVGEFASKEDAQSLLKSLVESGYPDAFIVKEAVEAEGGRTDLALRGQKNMFLLSETGFLVQPSSRTAYLSLDGKLYRGVLEISLNKS
ncbi:MAG: Sporulation related domain, partial [Acidobacteria bacterium]|nr:Sporulation related domain [Acidobacteriota bacterium]